MRLSKFVPVFSLSFFSFLLAWYLSVGWQLDLRVPLAYGGDGSSVLWFAKRLMEGVWYFNNSATGFPFGSNFLDYPSADGGSFLLFKLLGWVTQDYIVTVNLYFLLSFPVTAAVSFFVLRKLSVSTLFSLVGALVFTFSPFHFLRIGHTFYTWYFVIPLFVWFAVRIFSSTPPFFKPATKRSIYGDILLLFVLSSFGSYYALFGVFILCATGCIASIQRKHKKYFLSALLASLIVAVWVGVNVAPNVVYSFKHGVNEEVKHGSPVGSEIYGLKIVQLLLPRPGHRFEKFAQINQVYSQAFPLVTENALSSLGIVGSVGFLMLLGLVIIQKGKSKPDDVLPLFGSLVLCMLLLSTIGGFAVIFALVVTPMIRAWNRISVFIGFISISALMLVIDQYFNQHRTRFARYFMLMAAIGIALFSLWDQTTPPCRTCLSERQKEFTSDREFVHRIEQMLPAGSAVYQLPYMRFPEATPIYDLVDYSLLKGYLNATHLKWSYGGMKGREGDLFFRTLSTQSMLKQIEVIKRIGFGGIYIDRFGYQDRAAALEKELTQITKEVPIVSADKRLSFFTLVSAEHPAIQLPSGLTADQIMVLANFIVTCSDKDVRFPKTLDEALHFQRKEAACTITSK